MKYDLAPKEVQNSARIKRDRLKIAGLFVATLTMMNCSQGVTIMELLPPPHHPLALEETSCEVDAGVMISSVRRDLFGTNIEWFNEGNGLMQPGQGLDLKIAQLAREEGVSLVRFPGGTLSDYYHWTDGTGPEADRPLRKHYTDPGQSRNIFGTPELARFCAAAGAQPLITVNAGTGTSEEAAAWVSYCNDPTNPRRKADGMVEPLGVHFWEIGNELYLPGNSGDLKIAVTPEVYADRFLEFATHMRAVDPQIELIGIGVARANAVRLEHEDWTEILLKKAANEIDLIAVHNSYFPMIFADKHLSLQKAYQAMWAGPEAVDRSMTELEKLIARYQQKREIGIAVTEWGALFSFDRDWVDHEKTMGTAVYAARMLQVYLQHPKVRVANYFKLTDRSPIGWIAYDGVPKAPYYALKLMARHFGRRIVRSTTHSTTFTSPELRVMQSEKEVPEVTSCASLDEEGNTLYVNLVSRSWDTIHRVHLDLTNFIPASESATAWVLSAPNVTDHNGRDVPMDWPIPTDEPPRTEGFAGPINIAKTTIDLSKPISLPPYSILTLEIKRHNVKAATP